MLEDLVGVHFFWGGITVAKQKAQFVIVFLKNYFART